MYGLVLYVVALTLSHAAALPASTPSESAFDLILSQTLNLTRPPGQAVCDKTLGEVKLDDCMKAIQQLPHDPTARPVERNFYTAPQDISTTRPNVQVPFETTNGSCTAQILLAANFNVVPTDYTSWVNLIGPARILLRECVRDKGHGGLLVRNGNLGNLEVVLYNPDSMYGKVHIIRNSPDPVAKEIAQNELLMLLKLTPNIYDAPQASLMNGTTEAAVSGIQAGTASLGATS